MKFFIYVIYQRDELELERSSLLLRMGDLVLERDLECLRGDLRLGGDLPK